MSVSIAKSEKKNCFEHCEVKAVGKEGRELSLGHLSGTAFDNVPRALHLTVLQTDEYTQSCHQHALNFESLFTEMRIKLRELGVEKGQLRQRDMTEGLGTEKGILGAGHCERSPQGEQYLGEKW